MQYINAETWSRFEDLFPDAAVYLNEAELQGELRYLRSVMHPNDWQRDRLAELEHHHKLCDLLRRASSMTVAGYLSELERLS
jgi:hypothetical protein